MLTFTLCVSDRMEIEREIGRGALYIKSSMDSREREWFVISVNVCDCEIKLTHSNAFDK